MVSSWTDFSGACGVFLSALFSHCDPRFFFLLQIGLAIPLLG